MSTDYAYIRVSGQSQVDGDGPERQLAKIQNAIESFVPQDRVFFEEGVSGAKELANRKALSELMAVVEEGDRVWLERADRLARDTIVSEMLIREFQKLGVEVWSAEGRVNLTAGDSTDPTAKLIRQILAAVSEWEKDSIVIKLRIARERKKAETGRCDGRKPYGDRDGEREVLNTILVLGERGYGSTEIANKLNEQGFRTRKGTQWNPGTVWRLLKKHGTDQTVENQ